MPHILDFLARNVTIMDELHDWDTGVLTCSFFDSYKHLRVTMSSTDYYGDYIFILNNDYKSYFALGNYIFFLTSCAFNLWLCGVNYALLTFEYRDKYKYVYYFCFDVPGL